MGKRFKPEEIIARLREIEVRMGRGETAADRAAPLERNVLAAQASNSVSPGYLFSTPAQSGCTIDVTRLADDAVARIQLRPLACTTQNCLPNAALPFPRASVSPDGFVIVFEGPGVDPPQFDPLNAFAI